MYAIINGERYSDINRIEIREPREVVLTNVSATNVSGIIGVYCDDGFCSATRTPQAISVLYRPGILLF